MRGDMDPGEERAQARAAEFDREDFAQAWVRYHELWMRAERPIERLAALDVSLRDFLRVVAALQTIEKAPGRHPTQNRHSAALFLLGLGIKLGELRALRFAAGEDRPR